METTFGIGVAIIVAACLLGLAIFRKHRNTLRGFFLMDRELDLGPFVFSILAANLSVGNFLIFSAVWSYAFGFGGFFWFVVNLVLNIAVYRFFEPKFSEYISDRNNSGTVHEYLSVTFGQTPAWKKRIRFFAAVTTIVGLLFAIVFELHLATDILSRFLNVDPISLYLALTVLICIYSAMGGYQSLLVTDYVNSTAMIFGFVAIVAILWSVVFDPAQNVTPKSLPVSWNIFSIGLPNILSICAVGSGWFLVAMDQWQRTSALKDPKSIQPGMWLYFVFTLFFAAIFSAVGVLDKTRITPSLPPGHASQVSDGSNPLADLFLAGVTSNAHKYLFGLFALTLFAAAMSTANTFLIVCGHSFTSDILSGTAKDESSRVPSDNEISPLLELGRSSIVGMGALILLAWMILNVFGMLKNPLQFFFIAYSIQFALLAPILCTRLPARYQPKEQAVFHSLWVGVVVSIAWGLISWFRVPAASQAGGLANSWLVLTPLVTSISGLIVLGVYEPLVVAAIKRLAGRNAKSS